MELFDYLMAKKGHNTGRDLFSYLLGKNGGGESGTYTTFSGITLNISNTVFGKIKNFMLNSTELTQDGTPTPDNPVDVNVIKGENNVKVENKNLAPSNWGENFVSRINDSSLASITTQDNRNCVTYTANAGYGDYDNKYLFKTNWKENTQYTISYFAYSSTGYINLAIEYTDGTNTSIDGTPITNWSKITLTSTANKTIKYIRGRYTGGITYIDLDTFQVEEGIIATDYVEHQEQNYPISLSSKNLFDKDTVVYKNGYYINSSGEEVSTTISGYTTSFISVKPNTTYTISGQIRDVNVNGAIYYYDLTKNWLERKSWVGEETTSFTFTTSNNCYYIQFQYTQAVINSNTIQLEEGSTATTYEPYYNIEYCKIGDYANQISNQFESKNFFNLTAEDFNNGESVGAGKKVTLTLKPNTNYTLSSNTPGSSSETNIWFNGTSSAYNGVFNGTSKTFSTDSNGNIYIMIRTTMIPNIFTNYWIQLEEGDTATEYMPYGITKGEWYIYKEFKKYYLKDLTFSLSGKRQMSTTSIADILKPASNGNTIPLLCSHYINRTANSTYNGNQGISISQGKAIYIYDDNYNDVESLGDYNTWVQANNPYFIAKLETPQYIHISQEEYPTLKAQLDNLYNNAKSYNGQTNITQTNDGLPFNISVDVKIKTE